MHFLSLVIQQRNVTDNDWILEVLLGSLLLLCLFRLLFAKNFYALGNMEEYLSVNDNATFISFTINFLMVVMISLLVMPFWKIQYSHWFSSQFAQFLLIFAILTTVSLIRYLLEVLYFYAFNVSKDYDYLIRSNTFMNARSLVVLIVAVFLTFYSKLDKQYIFFGWFGILCLFRLWDLYFRYIKEKTLKSVLLYYYILYLCALEILPISVLFKLILNR